MSSNIIVPLPRESDNPSEKVTKTSGYLDDKKKALFTTTDTVIKERNNVILDEKMNTKPNVVEEAITPPILAKKKIDTVNKTDK